MAIKTNTQVVLRFNLKWGNGAPIDLRRHTGARCTLVMPDDTTAAITDLGYDRLTNQIWVRIAGTHNSQIGSYNANLAVMTQNLQMVTTGIVKVYDVAADGEDYKLVTLSLTVTSIDTPVNIGQGYSPKIVNGEWVVYDDSQQAYVPTGQSVVATEYVDEAVAAEAEARQQSVQSLESSLSSEVSRAQAKEAELQEAINGSRSGEIETSIDNAKIIDGYTLKSENGQQYPKSDCSTAWYPITAGSKVSISIPKTPNSYMQAVSYYKILPETKNQMLIANCVLIEGGRGVNGALNLTINSTEDYPYLAICYITAEGLPIVKRYDYETVIPPSVLRTDAQNYTEAQKAQARRNLGLVAETTFYSDKEIRFFGSSLTSGNGFTCFANIIADKLKCEYDAYIYDRADGSQGSSDVDVDYPRLVNYAKDGTTLAVRSSRHDSYVERVKRHVTASKNIYAALIQLSTNDFSYYSGGEISLGSIVKANPNDYQASDYTAVFDLSTSLGALEEICRYLTVEVPTHVGFYVPWLMPNFDPALYDPHVEVFRKWGIPFLDLRVCAGFNLKKCAKHRELYTKSSDANPIWNPASTYNLDDMVRYDGTLYKCKEDGVTAIPTDETYWRNMGSEAHDGVHLNDRGHELMANKIQQFFLSL